MAPPFCGSIHLSLRARVYWQQENAQKGAAPMKGRWRYHPFYLKVRFGALQLIVPFIIFQFIRTLLFPTSFDVVLLMLLALLYAAILCDWI
ncbi:hypothetical protein [Aneurinibacillus sp. UBA3580]|jgi:hypothetical protein|uniref:hypothetical protein n=1 Tax=Aneurinibacillus sp. UBA3580 TaxID=1946041 RepID=UPI00257FB51C|nr:hypothetical protein [Aneurinibacillus sp. UBA3580]